METQPQAPPAIVGVTPHINVVGASDASALYQRAFDAKEVHRLPAEDGKRLMHCHLIINGGGLLMADCFPEYGYGHEPSKSFTMHLQVTDPQAWWDRAVAAGLEVVSPLQVMFWGDKYGLLRDAFSVQWSIGGPPDAA